MRLELPNHLSMTLASNDAVKTFGPGGVHEVPDDFVKLLSIKVDDAITARPSTPSLGALMMAVGAGLGAWHVLGWLGVFLLGLGLLWGAQITLRTKQALKQP